METTAERNLLANAGQLVGRHAMAWIRRLNAPIEHPLLLSQAFVEWRAWEGGQVIEGADVNIVFYCTRIFRVLTFKAAEQPLVADPVLDKLFSVQWR
jgi:hypothetical protein